MKFPIATLSVTFRDASNERRDAFLAACEAGAAEELLKRQHATGVVRVATCSRVEWIISGDDARWAAELLRSRLQSVVEGDGQPGPAMRRGPQLRTGYAAAHYLFRVTCGLDSLAEGEAAVARQVLKAFSTAHAQKRTDRTLNLFWNQLGKLVHHKRLLVSKPGIGVQKLVLDELQERRLAVPALLFGRGPIGRSIEESLRAAGIRVTTHGRATREQFMALLDNAPLVIVAAGARAAWLSLPPRTDRPLVVDVSSPLQLVSREGWELVDLDHLLARPGVLMSDDEHARLDALIDTQLLDLSERLALRSNEALGELTQFRREFVERTLARLGSSVQDPQVLKDIKKEISEATHSLVLRTKGGST